MEKFNIESVLKKVPIAFMYFVTGISAGIFSGLLLYFISKQFYENLLNIWLKRILFGVSKFGPENWFILNNITSMLLIVGASLLMMIFIFKRRRYSNKRFRMFERKHPELTLHSMYIIPLGALVMNGFFIAFFIMYILLTLGITEFNLALAFTLPHGIVEVSGLLLATSLGLAYIDILKPYVLGRKWKESIKIGKRLLFSRTTLIFVVIILVLVVFSGYIEGSLTSQISK